MISFISITAIFGAVSFWVGIVLMLIYRKKIKRFTALTLNLKSRLRSRKMKQRQSRSRKRDGPAFIPTPALRFCMIT